MTQPKAFMPLYIGDYLADTSDLSAEEHGAYFLLLITMWRRGGSLPSDGKRLCRIASVTPDRWPAVWEVIGGFFGERNGHITQKRLTKELQAAREKQAAVSSSARHAARKRWAKKRAAEEDDDDPGSEPRDTSARSPAKSSGRAPGGSRRSTSATTPKHAPSNAHRNADAMRTALRTAMRMQCPSSSSSSSSSTAPSTSPAPSPSPLRLVSPPTTAAGYVMQYMNDLTQGCFSEQARDGKYLRERLAEGQSLEDCWRVVEAAVASGVDHPRAAFSRQSFAGLLAVRKDPSRWAGLRARFDALLERYDERRYGRCDEREHERCDERTA